MESFQWRQVINLKEPEWKDLCKILRKIKVFIFRILTSTLLDDFMEKRSSSNGSEINFSSKCRLTLLVAH